MIGFTTEEESQKALVKDTAISETKGKTVLELYPQYGFGIAERIWRQLIIAIRSISGILTIVYLICCFFLISNRGSGSFPTDADEMVFMLTTVYSIIVPFMFYHTKKMVKLLGIKPKIFYVQIKGYRGYLFIIDEQKHWGLINNSSKNIIIKPQYDHLEWHQKGIYLEATLNNEKIIIDINGNKCL